MNISNNISSIQAQQTIQNSSANNIANINTDLYKPTSVVISENGNSIKPNLRQADDTLQRQSQTDLSKELPDQIVSQKATEVNVNAIKTQDDMFGSLLDIKA